MKFLQIRVLFCAGMFVPSFFSLLAQETVETGSIVLEVKDQSGAFIPNAHIQVAPGPKNIEKNFTTESDGKVRLDLSPGSYNVIVESTGFLAAKERIEVKP